MGTVADTSGGYKYEYRASSLGSCLKSLIAGRLGYDGLDVYSDMQVLKEGDLHEGDVVNRLREQGFIVSRQQEELEYVLSGFGVRITGHIDGVSQFRRAENETDPPCLLEIKSMGDSSFKDFKRRGWGTPGLIQKYKWQTSFYMHMLSMPMMFVCKNRNSGEIYTDLVKVPFYSWAEIVARLTAVEIAARNNDLPEKCEWAMYPCPYNYLHEEEAEDIYIGDDDLSQLVARYIELRDRRDELAKQCKDLLGQIKDASGGKKVSLPFATVSVVEKTTKGYDIDKMRENGIDVDEYEKVDLSRFVTVRKKKAKEDDEDSDHS